MAAAPTAPRVKRHPAREPSTAKRRPRPSSTSRTRRRAITPPAGLAIPAAAVGKTAVAVGGLADSGIVVRLTRSRLWIGLIAALLVGIVALNVYALSLNASGSRVAQEAEGLALENSALRAQLTERLSNERISSAASKLGLIVPAPDSIRYLRGSDADAAAAAERLLEGRISGSAAPDPEPAVTEPVAPAPEAVAPVEPVAPVTDPVPVDPAAAPATVPPPVVP